VERRRFQSKRTIEEALLSRKDGLEPDRAFPGRQTSTNMQTGLLTSISSDPSSSLLLTLGLSTCTSRKIHTGPQAKSNGTISCLR